ncbi:MAG: ABC transporter ATP-binding protein [Acidipropionibacterium sp.]|jgi:ABC-2 type transport system ATP-binding protein|nr:ABC transporter ATP-binding protein [Acidipropionibacterium sp.]
MSSFPAIHLDDLHKTFPGGRGGHGGRQRSGGPRKPDGRRAPVTAVDGIDLRVSPGEVVALLGPNGAGKTTTIDAILGLTAPTSGTVRVFGMAPREAVAHGLVAAVMQTGGLLPDLSVRETVEITASLFTHSVSVSEAIERAGLDGLASRQVRKCSGGEKQRLRFAMALVCDPALMILDEPTTGMDVEARRSFWQAIHADAELGRTVLFATHYLEEADEFADRIILMREGRIVADGTSAQIRAMVSGRTLRATLRPETDRDAVRRLLAGVGVTGLEVLGNSLTVVAQDTDAVAFALLEAGVATDLDITSRGLEDAFVALTSSASSSTTTSSSSSISSPPTRPEGSTRSTQEVLA